MVPKESGINQSVQTYEFKNITSIVVCRVLYVM